jgi:phytoene/squalene synthetase
MFWPREVWGRHARHLEDFKDAGNTPAAVACLNELVTDALRHGPSSLAYMARLRDPDIFRFCAIPQVMAIGTLALCYDNHDVFTGTPLASSHQVICLTGHYSNHGMSTGGAPLLLSRADARVGLCRLG